AASYSPSRAETGQDNLYGGASLAGREMLRRAGSCAAGKNIYKASSIKGAFEFGRQVPLTEMNPVDLILCGSVAVRRDGARVGKGGGYSDLEYGLAREAGKITARTPIFTTVHPTQIVDEAIELKPHDIPLDFIITPDEIIECHTRLPRPRGIYWEYLNSDKIDAIPVLKKLRRETKTSPQRHRER